MNNQGDFDTPEEMEDMICFIAGGGYSHRKKYTEKILIVLTVCLGLLFAVLLIRDEQEQKAAYEKTVELQKKNYKERQEKIAALKQKEEKDSFYQKLADGFDVNILIIGDSISEAGSGQNGWCTLLKNYLKSVYKGSVRLTNVSMGGNASYAGYVRTMTLDDGVDYDLAVIGYGHNDSMNGFSMKYESIVRAVEKKYPNCSLISILESSQREYTEKMRTIQSICKHYGIPVADTIEAFRNSGIAYDKLAPDGVHPGEDGHRLYFETVKAVIEENVAASTGKMQAAKAVNADVNRFDNFLWYGVDNKGFKRVDDVTYIAAASAAGILDIDYMFESGSNKADIYVDGKLYKSPTVTFDYDFSKRYILVVSEDCTVEKEIKVVFATPKQADGFRGMCFSWK